jgi:predicted butyrate kinase (DUF1464 family)
MAVRVVGIDPGTRSFDILGLEDGEVFLDESIPSTRIAEEPEALAHLLMRARPLDLVVGPSGYGLPLKHISELTDDDLFQSVLVRPDDVEIPVLVGLTRAVKKLKNTGLNIIFIPGVVQLPTVPEYRKINAIDMGTADKLCCAVLAVYDYSARHGVPYEEVSIILLEIGFGYNAGIAIERGRIVDGIGGTRAGPGFLTSGAMDGEVAYLLGPFSKATLFSGGVRTIVGDENFMPEDFSRRAKTEKNAKLAWEAFMEGLEKTARALQTSVKRPEAIIISGRLSNIPEIYAELSERLSGIARVERIVGLRARAKAAAQGAALIADGLAGGRAKSLINHMRIAEASGTVLDHVYIGDLRRKYVRK